MTIHPAMKIVSTFSNFFKMHLIHRFLAHFTYNPSWHCEKNIFVTFFVRNLFFRINNVCMGNFKTHLNHHFVSHLTCNPSRDFEIYFCVTGWLDDITASYEGGKHIFEFLQNAPKSPFFGSFHLYSISTLRKILL